MFEEYGKEEDLTEILERLVLYCAINMANPNGIRVILPKKAIEAYNRSLKAKQYDAVLTNEILKNKENTLSEHMTSNGSVWVHTIEGNEEAIKGLV